MRFPFASLCVVLAVLIWSVIAPVDRLTWGLESFPVLIALPLLVLTYKKFRLTNFLYALIVLHCAVLLVGGHYTYAKVPPFNWLRDHFGLARNHYDRLGHFFQGFIPALIGRELVVRTTPLKAGKWLFALLALSALGLSALYEIFEWLTAVTKEEQADMFLGTQGDVWDTQKDMMMAGIGAVVALALFSNWHDKAMQRLTHENR